MKHLLDPVAPRPRETLTAALAPLDRRGFLRLAAGVAATGFGSAGCSGAAGGLGPPPGITPKVLSPRTWAVLNVTASRLLGPGAGRLISTRTVDPARNADAWLSQMGGLGAALSQGLWLLELGVWPLIPKLRPFTALGSEGQDRVLADLMQSATNLKRDLYNGLKSTICLSFYTDPRSRTLTGYPGPFGGESDQLAAATRYPVELPVRTEAP